MDLHFILNLMIMVLLAMLVFDASMMYLVVPFTSSHPAWLAHLIDLMNQHFGYLSLAITEHFQIFYTFFSTGRVAQILCILIALRYTQLLEIVGKVWEYEGPTPIPPNPSFHASDCTVILPTLDPTSRDFQECVTSCLLNEPGALIIVTVGQRLTKLAQEAVAPLRQHFPDTTITVTSTRVANKRMQIAHAIPLIRTSITVLMEDHVFWTSSRFLRTLIAPFEKPVIGYVCATEHVRRTSTGFGLGYFWDMLAGLYLEHQNFKVTTAIQVDTDHFILGRGTAAVRTQIITCQHFMTAINKQRLYSDKAGFLNAEQGTFLSRWVVLRGWKMKIQSGRDAVIETTLVNYPRSFSQYPDWLRGIISESGAEMFQGNTGFFYGLSIYLWFFINFSPFYDSVLLYMYTMNPAVTQRALITIIVWIMATRIVRVLPYYGRNPLDLIFLPAYLVFIYFHFVLKLYLGFTYWDIASICEETMFRSYEDSIYGGGAGASLPAPRANPRPTQPMPLPPIAETVRSESDSDSNIEPMAGLVEPETKRTRGRPRKTPSPRPSAAMPGATPIVRTSPRNAPQT